MLLIYVADAVWIVTLSIIAGASRQAARRIGPQTRAPLSFRAGGKPGWRAPRTAALVGPPVLATIVGLALLLLARQAESANAQLILFGVRIFVASIFALAHMLWLTAALRTLADEGALKP